METANGLRAATPSTRDGVTRMAGAPHGATGGVADLLNLLGAESGAVRVVDDAPIPIRRLREGDTLFHSGMRADAIYFVRAGTFKTFSTASRVGKGPTAPKPCTDSDAAALA